jgi:hypothetical protein
MQQRELASQLDISPAMVSRLAKRGMPTDTLERAEKWRRRHLEPSRIKGTRIDTVKAAPGKPASQAQSETTQGNEHPSDMTQDRIKAAALAGPVSLAIVELWSNTTRHAQASGADAAGQLLLELRALLRRLKPGDDPRMALGVWLALTDYSMCPDCELRQATDLDALLSPNDFAARVNPDCPNWGDVWLHDMACDWEGYAVNGWPAGYEDD